MAVVTLDTKAACELGMPPEPTNHLKLKRCSRLTPRMTLIVCAIAQDQKPEKKTVLRHHWARTESGLLNVMASFDVLRDVIIYDFYLLSYAKFIKKNVQNIVG